MVEEGSNAFSLLLGRHARTVWADLGQSGFRLDGKWLWADAISGLQRKWRSHPQHRGRPAARHDEPSDLSTP